MQTYSWIVTKRSGNKVNYIKFNIEIYAKRKKNTEMYSWNNNKQLILTIGLTVVANGRRYHAKLSANVVAIYGWRKPKCSNRKSAYWSARYPHANNVRWLLLPLAISSAGISCNIMLCVLCTFRTLYILPIKYVHLIRLINVEKFISKEREKPTM